ncbi:hypothetical protein NT6N_11430 [Oceaniferula spumae]|uniref:Ice-binding protein C-terminal domain-containing protein n=1 Tax=Oceaniferula spumae TaxID=2979115 RepID=A0AAT9FJG6_9BACT
MSVLGTGVSQAVVTMALTTADVNAAAGNTTHNFNQSFTDSNGVAVTLNFLFAASESPNGLGNPSFGVQAVTGSGRLGIDSVNGHDLGANGSNSFNLNEVFTLTVSYVSATGVPSGQTLQIVDFAFTNIDAFRAGATNGSVTYNWDSSARSATQSQTNAGTGAISGVSDDQTFDLLGGDYVATLSISSQTGSSPSGMRFGTDGFDATITTVTVPEPSSAALLGLGGIALILRRRK